MAEVQVRVENPLGIHARPATKIIQTAGQFFSEVTLAVDGMRADAKSIMSVMMLAAVQGSVVTIRAEGSDEDAALAALVALFQRKFDEE